jgi:hypothetical protein
MLELDSLKTFGNVIYPNGLVAFVECLTVRLRKFSAARPAAPWAFQVFRPLVAFRHPANMRRKLPVFQQGLLELGNSVFPNRDHSENQKGPFTLSGVGKGHYPPPGTGRTRPLAISKQLASKTQFNGVYRLRSYIRFTQSAFS